MVPHSVRSLLLLACAALYFRVTVCHHLVEHPAGPTALENLALVCEAHHHLVHESGWQLRPLDDGGWTARSPTGTERTRPPRERPPTPDPPAPPTETDQLQLLAG